MLQVIKHRQTHKRTHTHNYTLYTLQKAIKHRARKLILPSGVPTASSYNISLKSKREVKSSAICCSILSTEGSGSAARCRAVCRCLSAMHSHTAYVAWQLLMRCKKSTRDFFYSDCEWGGGNLCDPLDKSTPYLPIYATHGNWKSTMHLLEANSKR